MLNFFVVGNRALILRADEIPNAYHTPVIAYQRESPGNNRKTG